MKNTKKLDQSGMVSILVTMIMLIVISLIVLGFGQVARRNQREVLDRQLSTQAFYAAETGVNDVLNLVGHGYDPATDTTSYDSCAHGVGNNFIEHTFGMQDLVTKSTLDATANIKYTCLLVTPKVPSVVQTVSLGDSRAVPLNLSVPSDLTFTWQSASGSTTTDGSQCPTSRLSPNSFVPSDEWNTVANPCDFGILRVDLFDATSSPTTPAAMEASTAAIYFVPTSSTTDVSSLNFGGANVIAAKCNNGTCTATILKAAVSSHIKLYARESAIYEGLNQVTITGNSGVTFAGAQLLIDATGRAQDELKRIQVRVQLSGSSEDSAPSNAVQSGKALCKRFEILGTGHNANDGDDSDIPAELCSAP